MLEDVRRYFILLGLIIKGGDVIGACVECGTGEKCVGADDRGCGLFHVRLCMFVASLLGL